MITCKGFNEYRLLDAGDEEKLEDWNGIILRRPDPMAIWPKMKKELWHDADAAYHRSSQGGGHWKFFKDLDDHWTIDHKDLTFKISPTNFKHTGLFPEQAANWDYIYDTISKHQDQDIRVLNLFAYTGAATMAASKAGAKEVVHVDASKGMVAWAKENMHLSKLDDHLIRFMVDDCLKFIQKEIRRGRKYQCIIMDPPSYGRGPKGEMFQFKDQINTLLSSCKELLADDALFMIVNSYTTGYSATVLENVMRSHLDDLSGKIISDELGIMIEGTDVALPCGLTTRWERV